MKLTEKQQMVMDYLKDNGGRVTLDDMCEGIGLGPKSVNPIVTGLGTKGRGKGLVNYEKIAEGEKTVKWIYLTDAGKDFVPTED